ncbi:LysR family transcriptional regulator [Nitrospirillum viridazoti]|uniref:LysR family transcriptional regulator n=2 Tax=Nitrospirillum TaxID=1543705 RepID=A0A560I912_9PROT|nr:LysR family transcriptional regulator [Nitrospirillum amazonense]
MADTFSDMATFVRVVEAGSLSAAARELGQSLAVISRRVSGLEERLGVRLLNRTTRTLALTEEGAAYHARCVRILAEVEEAEMEATKGRHTATGLLRLTSTVAFSRHLAPLLQEFQALHPGLQVHLHAADTLFNIIDNGFDLAIRFGALADSSLIARQLAPNRRVICGAPAYLDRRGRPQAPEDLLGHDCLLFGDPPPDQWTFADGRSVRVRGPLSSNDGERAHAWARTGAGLVLKSIWDVHEDIAAGRLEVVLPHLPLPAAPLHAVYPHSRHAAAKVRLCVDFLADRLRRMTPALADHS